MPSIASDELRRQFDDVQIEGRNRWRIRDKLELRWWFLDEEERGFEFGSWLAIIGS